MTVDTHNGSFPDNKDDALSHYFNELLPSQELSNEPMVEPSDKPYVEPEKPENKADLDNKTPDSQEASEAAPSILSSKTVTTKKPIEIAPPAERKPTTQLNSDKAPQVSASLEPIDERPAEENVDSIGYQAHKQRLEKMLQQLTPVNSVPLLSESSSLLSGQTKAADTPPVSDANTNIEPSTSTEESLDTQPLSVQTQVLSSEWLENGRPNWAQEVFDILLIDVNGLKLALPLVALGHIEAIEEDLTPLFGQSKWFLGLQKTAFGNIKTIDTAEYVMPEKGSKDSAHNYQFVVSISGMNWGLAVDSIDQPITIDPESIRWRANRSNRPWMAGTVKDHMCVLLDIPSMGDILQKEDQNHRNPTGE